MDLNFANYAINSPKPMPIFLLLDTSNSMEGEKIQHLNEAVRTMLRSFSHLDKEVEIQTTAITFNSTVETVFKALPPSAALEFLAKDLEASGTTSMGQAISRVKGYIEDRSFVKGRSYRPLVVLVSDGMPTDEVNEPISNLVSTGRSQKTLRLALSIGNDANINVLNQFIGREQLKDGTKHLFYAAQAQDIHKFFKFVTMSVTTMTSTVAKAKNDGFNQAKSDEIVDLASTFNHSLNEQNSSDRSLLEKAKPLENYGEAYASSNNAKASSREVFGDTKEAFASSYVQSSSHIDRYSSDSTDKSTRDRDTSRADIKDENPNLAPKNVQKATPKNAIKGKATAKKAPLEDYEEWGDLNDDIQ